ncbi:MAG TPA: hypothetical protein VIT85_07885 [Solirubrobacterales bacterium]
MPGNAYHLYCSGCGTKHEVTTGAPMGGGLIEQGVCHSCELIVSHWPQEPERCPTCYAGLEPWAGRVWFEPRPGDEPGEERFEGPCPKCGTQITLADQAAPDGTVTITLWD